MDIIIWIPAGVCDESTLTSTIRMYAMHISSVSWKTEKKLGAIRSGKLISRWKKNTKGMLRVIIV